MPSNDEILAAMMARGGAPFLGDHTIPDTTDSGRMLPDPQPFRAGGLAQAYEDGGAAFGVFPQTKKRREQKSDIGEDLYKTFFIPQDMLDVALMAVPFGKAGRAAAAGLSALSPMDAEAGKVKTGVDLGRRALFGLNPSQEMKGREVVPVEKMRQELSRAEKTPKAEKVATPPTAVSSVESVMQKISAAPVSRRTVLKTAAGQAMKGLMPDSGMIGDIAKAVNPVESVVRQAAPTITAVPTIGGLLAKALSMGLDQNQAVKYVHSMLPGSTEKVVADHLDHMYPVMKNPYDELSREAEYFINDADDVDRAFDAGKRVLGSPLEILGDMISPTITNKGMNLRSTMRGIREADPQKYDEILKAARDAAEYLYEP